MFKNVCRCNAAVSDLYDGKSKNKIAVIFFFLILMAATNPGVLHTFTANLKSSSKCQIT